MEFSHGKPMSKQRPCYMLRDFALQTCNVLFAQHCKIKDNDAIERFRTDDSAWRTWDTDGSLGLHRLCHIFPECVARVPVSLWGSGG